MYMILVKLMLILVIITIIFVLIHTTTSDLHTSEPMELTTNCYVRDQGCMIACENAQTPIIYEKCYNICQSNSTVC